MKMKFQGDIAFIAVPTEWKLNRADPMPRGPDGRLVIAAGELSGHNHVIDRKATPEDEDEINVCMEPSVLYRDNDLLTRMIDSGPLTARARGLYIGFLEVYMPVDFIRHEEHDPVLLECGVYYVGRQLESAGAEERVVSD